MKPIGSVIEQKVKLVYPRSICIKHEPQLGVNVYEIRSESDSSHWITLSLGHNTEEKAWESAWKFILQSQIVKNTLPAESNVKQKYPNARLIEKVKHYVIGTTNDDLTEHLSGKCVDEVDAWYDAWARIVIRALPEEDIIEPNIIAGIDKIQEYQSSMEKRIVIQNQRIEVLKSEITERQNQIESLTCVLNGLQEAKEIFESSFSK